ncbi:MAG TPA: capsule assembly Wzi family protein [Bacteroidales bacterium]
MTQRIKLFFPLFIAFIQYHSSPAQTLKIPSYSVEFGSASSIGRETPFWLISNQYGLLTPSKFNNWVKAGFKSQLSNDKSIDFDYGLELVNRYSARNKFYLNQGYARLKLWFANIQAGSMEEKFGNQDSSLSSGGLLWSGNARPMPKVAIYIPKYIAVPFTKGYFEFKGGISHGWFGDQPFAKNYWLHHKYIYLQFGGSLPVHIHYGLHHFAQWGGVSDDPSVGTLPHGLKDFVDIFLAKGGGSNSPLAEKINVLGNHIGSRNFGLDVNLKDYKTGIYWQTIFEDGSGKAYRNISDGLWGIYLHTKDKHKPMNGFVYEFIKTTNQSGPYNDYWLLNGVRYLYPISGGEHHEAGGNDNYFNHGIYRAGWTYDNMTIGTPLITSPAITHGDQYNYITNNKIIAHHIAFEGGFNHLLYKIFYTYSLNYGSNYTYLSQGLYPEEHGISQHSFMFQANLPKTLPWGLDLQVTVGVDQGKMYGNNGGVMISIVKNGKL